MQSLVKLPTLYKLSSTNQLMQWDVEVFGTNDGYGHVVTKYGYHGSENIQSQTDTVKLGKNAGKKNETTPQQQAIVQANQLHKKKAKEGYCEDINLALAGNVRPGIDPMLADKYKDCMNKVVFPAVSQPKLDGMRCIAVYSSDGEVNLFSRERNPIPSVPHINCAIKQIAIQNNWNQYIGPDQVIEVDGELYNHEYRDDFNQIMSILKRSKTIHPDSLKAQYHIYDMPNHAGVTMERLQMRDALFAGHNEHLVMVESSVVNSHEEIEQALDHFLELGYEGVMIRNFDARYEKDKRSKGLLKYKPFVDEEYQIVGYLEGTGHLMGCVGAFICTLPDGRTFKTTPKATRERKREYFERINEIIGKMVTIRYIRKTPAGIPKHGAARSIRDYE